MATTTTPVPTTRAYADSNSSTSARLFKQAQAVMPGGNSRTSVFMAPHPPYAAEGEGCWVAGRRRRPPPRPPQQLHVADPRPRAPGHHRGDDPPPRPRRLVPDADARGDRARLAPRRAAARGRPGALHQFRERGRDDGDEGRARLHRALEDRQVRGRVSRLLRLRRGEPRLDAPRTGARSPSPPASRTRAARRRPSSRTWSSCRSIAPSWRHALIERHARELAAVIIDPVPNRVG